MNTYLALFRGLNIGGHNKIPMNKLSSVFEGLQCRNIQTYIQSGNVIFDTNRENRNKLVSDIQQAVEEASGVIADVFLMTKDELEEVVAKNPFPVEDGKALHFIFMKGPAASPDMGRLDEYRTDTEEYMLGDKVFYLYAPKGVGRSKLAMNIERCLGVAATGRNWNTVGRLAAMMG